MIGNKSGYNIVDSSNVGVGAYNLYGNTAEMKILQ